MPVACTCVNWQIKYAQYLRNLDITFSGTRGETPDYVAILANLINVRHEPLVPYINKNIFNLHLVIQIVDHCHRRQPHRHPDRSDRWKVRCQLQRAQPLRLVGWGRHARGHQQVQQLRDTDPQLSVSDETHRLQADHKPAEAFRLQEVEALASHNEEPQPRAFWEHRSILTSVRDSRNSGAQHRRQCPQKSGQTEKYQFPRYRFTCALR